MKKLAKEELDKGELIRKSLEAAEKAKDILNEAASYVMDATGESFLFARLDSHVNDIDDTIDDLTQILAEMENGKPVQESDGEGGGNWSQYGEYTKPLPGDCIKDCASPGQRDSEVAMWVEELDFANGMPIEKAKNYIAEYGAWDREELDEKSDEEIAQIVLWIFAGNVHEEAYMFLRDGYKEDYPDLEELPDDVSDWSDEDWEAFQNVYCSLSLSN